MTEYQPRSEFLKILFARGFVHQCSDLEGVDQKALSGDLTAYIGFDCTAASLHVGSLLPIMMLHWLQQTGGKPITLMGGGTTRVGDPVRQGREPQDADRRADRRNKAGIQRFSTKFLTFGRRKDRRADERQ